MQQHADSPGFESEPQIWEVRLLLNGSRTIQSPLIFNARSQRSWRRHLWDRPRTRSSPSSWRLQRWDTIRARITKFGPKVELDERCSHTTFDLSGYFRSPASGHFVSYFQISRSNISGTPRHKCTKFGVAIEISICYIFSKFYCSSSCRSSV